MRRKVFYRHLNKTNNNLYKYQFYGISAEDLALYLYNLGIEKENIVKYADKLICDDEFYKKIAKTANPYGDGKASERIVDAIIEKFKT